jgi:serine phosphatase RsbU (regulator of sigma subunit)/tetratricopeptide (TPR) repeat protein
MIYLRRTLCFVMLLFFSTLLISQNEKVDSLKNEIRKPIHDTTKLALYYHIANAYFDEGAESDSVMLYAEKIIALADNYIPEEIKTPVTDSVVYTAIKRKAAAYYLIGYNAVNLGEFVDAIPFLNKSNELNEKIKFNAAIASNYTPLGIIQYALGNYEGAIDHFQKGKDIFIEIEDFVKVATSYNNIGVIYRHQGLYDKALENYMASLKVYEAAKHKEGEGKSHNNIAIVHNYLKNFQLAIDHYTKALLIFEEIQDKREINRVNNNLGIVYNNMAEAVDDEEIKEKYFKKAIVYYENSLKTARELNDKIAVSAGLSNIASLYTALHQYQKAHDYLFEALKLDKEMGDIAGMASIYSRLLEMYNAMAQDIRNQNQIEGNPEYWKHLENAIKFGEIGYKLAVDVGAFPTQRAISQQLIIAYKYAGNSNKALYFAERYIEVNESIYNEDRTRVLTEMQTKYEAEKKALEIENLNKENALNIAELAHSEEQRKRQLVIIYSFIVGFIIIVVFSLVITRLFIQKKRANILLAEQKEQIQEQNAMLQEAMEEIRAQKEEIESQHEVVVKQKEFIEIQKDRIDDSIRYAKRIQNAVLPEDNFLATVFEEYFVLFQPKDVVSGDFYWTTAKNEWVIVAAADCTGHGVPGAFMSMLGMSFLNQIIATKPFENAALILQELRNEIIKALRQTNDEQSQLDGMDISLAAINTNTNMCHWAGANNPLWIIRNDYKDFLTDCVADGIEEIKGDKMPIGLYIRMDDYTNHAFKLNKGDKLYFFSDGYVDQFGGLEKKKFNRKALKNLLIETADMPMNKQKEVLENTILEWKNPVDGTMYDQIDDVVVLGIKV